MQEYQNIIIGSGPAGLMCGAKLSKNTTLILEKNPKIGGKIKVSGGGRCNVTNNKPNDKLLEFIIHNPKFLYPALNNFNSSDIINFFETNNCSLVEENHNRVFPKDHNSQTIINTLKRVIDQNHQTIITNYNVTTIDYNQEQQQYIINQEFICTNLIIATGGKTYSHLGTTGDGYRFAEQFNHTITELAPCETPLVSNDPIIQNHQLQGISLRNITATIFVNNKKKKTITQDILFTHFGLSGPLALHFSYFVIQAKKKNHPVRIELDLTSCDIPKRMQKIIDEDKLIINIHDTKGWKTAFVTNGGIKLKEVSPQTYQSKLQENLYFIGEVLDINAFTGGYNITTCLSEGALCAKAINELKNE